MTIFDEIKEAYQYAGQENMTEEEIRSDMNTKRTVSTLMSCASLVLTALNLYNQYWIMAISTAILALVFAFCITFSETGESEYLFGCGF